MPERSNPFQRLVKIIECQLWPEADLTESAEVGGREIDILIEHQAGGTEFRIAVECRDHKRAQSREWIDSLIGKYGESEPQQGSIPAAHKVIAVSSSGFSEAAYEKARNSDLGIELLTLDEAEKVEWGDFELLSEKIPVQKITLHPYTIFDLNPEPEDVQTQVLLDKLGEPRKEELSMNVDGDAKEIPNFVLSLINNQRSPPYVVSRALSSLYGKSSELTAGEGYTSVKAPILSENIELTDRRGGRYRLNSVRYHFAYTVEERALPLMEAAYRGARTFSGSDELFGLGLSVALLERKENEGIRFSVAVTVGDTKYHIESRELPLIDGEMKLAVGAIGDKRTGIPPGKNDIPENLTQS